MTDRYSPDPTRSAPEVVGSLDAWLEGELDDAASAAWARRLAEDAELREELRVTGLLRRRTAELPAELSPERDLWPGIAARLEARPAKVRRGPWRVEEKPWRQALAALLGVAFGVALTLATVGGLKESAEPVPQLADLTPDATEATGVMPAGLTGMDISNRIESDFLRARETLWVELLARRNALPPESWQAIVDNLALLDSVIRELRSALDEDPGNRRLERLLLTNHQRQLDVLNRVTRQV